MRMGKIRLVTPLNVGYTIVSITIGVFSNQISSLITLPTPWIVILFILSLGILIIIQFLKSKNAERSGSNSNRTNISSSESSKMDEKRAILRELSFPVGLFIGILLTSSIYFISGSIFEFNSRVLYISNNYEVISSLVGILFCIIIKYRRGIDGLLSLTLGYGFGQAMIISVISPEHNDPFTTIVLTVILYQVVSVFLGAVSWKSLLVVPAVYISLYPLSWLHDWLNSGGVDYQSYIEEVEIHASGIQSFYYEEPFKSIPFLKVISWDTTTVRFRVIRQDEKHFEIQVDSSSAYPFMLRYEARGVRSPDYE